MIVAHSHHTALKFVRNYLDVASRLEEAIAALIMVLGFTLIAGSYSGLGKSRECALCCSARSGVIPPGESSTGPCSRGAI